MLDTVVNNKIVMDDLNRRVGINNKGAERSKGKEGDQIKHNNVERIINLNKVNDLVISNTKFLKYYNYPRLYRFIKNKVILCIIVPLSFDSVKHLKKYFGS